MGFILDSKALGYVSMMSFIVALAFTRPESGFFWHGDIYGI